MEGKEGRDILSSTGARLFSRTSVLDGGTLTHESINPFTRASFLVKKIEEKSLTNSFCVTQPTRRAFGCVQEN